MHAYHDLDGYACDNHHCPRPRFHYLHTADVQHYHEYVHGTDEYRIALDHRGTQYVDCTLDERCAGRHHIATFDYRTDDADSTDEPAGA